MPGQSLRGSRDANSVLWAFLFIYANLNFNFKSHHEAKETEIKDYLKSPSLHRWLFLHIVGCILRIRVTRSKCNLQPNSHQSVKLKYLGLQGPRKHRFSLEEEIFIPVLKEFPQVIFQGQWAVNKVKQVCEERRTINESQ